MPKAKKTPPTDAKNSAADMAESEELANQQRATKYAPEREIGARIKAKREKLGMNFEQLAALTREYDPEAMGIAAVTLRRYERTDEGRSFPDLRALRILVDTLDVSADFLIMGRMPDAGELERWNMFKGLVRSIADEKGLPNAGSGDPYKAFERNEKLSRARLHTKSKDEES